MLTYVSSKNIYFLFHQAVAFPAGTSTPAFGQSAAPGPIPFGTPGQGFNSIPFGKSFRHVCLYDK